MLEEIGRRGAPFFADIVRGTKRLPTEVEEALWQLVAAGLVTADGFDALRSLIDAKRRLGEKGLRARPRSSSGRWTLLRSETERIDADAFARRLLARWGVVFRDIVARETLAPSWRELLVALRRMEARGEIRGGRFVAGLRRRAVRAPEAIEALRAARRSGEAGEVVDVGAYDPLQLAVAMMPAPRSLSAIAAPLPPAPPAARDGQAGGVTGAMIMPPGFGGTVYPWVQSRARSRLPRFAAWSAAIRAI